MKACNIVAALVLGVSLVAAPAAQAEWIPVYDNYAFNTEHIGITGPMRAVFVRLDKPGVQNGKKYEYMVVRQEVNCNDWVMTVLSISKYDNKGTVVDSVTIPAGYREDIQIFPETKADILAKRVCAISSQNELM
ncbi:surface-adhesin E family protein [Paraburkholderia guartelaensis]|uniref:surface-adhesin E family protein n=1 Tax=Paraburkholderia guartelaensis TaxID=2546446 RepID=UPI002AB7F062|nr:surface-adhesin E family protein [Paraburkholderia guartelaensis]